jgi:heme/copper-type cytochrome/quinol oxidase subunit 3
VTTLEPEPADIVARNLAVGARLGSGATTFVFFCPFFAYFYLRSLNEARTWPPPGVDPPQGLGAAVMVLVLASSAALLLAARPARGSAWLALVALSLVLGLAGVAVQCVEYTRLGFGPTDGGYASVFVTWTGLTALFVFGTMLWLETLLAYGLRIRARASSRADDLDEVRAVIRPRLQALAFYSLYLAGLGVVMWAVLYLA